MICQPRDDTLIPMGRVHYALLFQDRDQYAVLHPSCPTGIHLSAASKPIHAVGRSRIGRLKTTVYEPDNLKLLFSLMRSDGHWPCSTCKKISFGAKEICSDVVWEDAWIQSVGMSRFETVPEWERIFESIADAVGGAFRMERDDTKTPIEEHEQVLGITPPYDRNVMLKAFRAAAMKAHPDRGGSEAAMRRVIEARDALGMSLAG